MIIFPYLSMFLFNNKFMNFLFRFTEYLEHESLSHVSQQHQVHQSRNKYTVSQVMI